MLSPNQIFKVCLFIGLAVPFSGCGKEKTTSVPPPNPADVSKTEDVSKKETAQPTDTIANLDKLYRVKDIFAAQEKVREVDVKRKEIYLAGGNAGAAFNVQLEWPYKNCTDAASLIPPPLKGWGITSDVSFGEYPKDGAFASIVYSFDGTVSGGNSSGNRTSSASKSIDIRISSGTATTKALQDSLNNDQLKDVMFEPGPYNYPKQKMVQAALLGPYFVQVNGGETEEMGVYDEVSTQYFSRIIACAIDNGLIADGVDRASLTR